MHYKKAIILVIASEDNLKESIFRNVDSSIFPLYPYFKNIWEQYHLHNSQIKVVFVYANTKHQKQPWDLVYTDIEESYWPGILQKTIKAITDINLTYTYDYLIRTNLSTFWDLDNLVKRLDQLPKTDCFTGTHVRIKDPQLHYISGWDMVISRNLTDVLVNNYKEIINTKCWMNLEDLAITQAFEKFSGILPNTELIINNGSIINMPGKVFREDLYIQAINYKNFRKLDHFRVKNRYNRQLDKLVLNRLLYDTYGKQI